jgi:hypothetical protein
MHFCNCFLQAVYDDVLDPELPLFIDEAWFHLSGYTSAQDKRYYSSISLRNPSAVPLHEQNTGVLNATIATHS